MRAGALAACALLALLAGCGGASKPAAPARARPPARTPLLIERPADGSRLRARATAAGTLRVRARLRGSGPPGTAVYLDANCRPRACDARATASASGRWSVAMTLTTTTLARFVTIDVGSRPKPAPPVSVTTLELVGPRATRTAPRPPARAPSAPTKRTLPHEVLVIGDSLAVGMADALRAALPGWQVRIDAKTSRPLAEGLRILAAEVDPPAIVAFSLFTNDGPTQTGALDAAVRSTAQRRGGCAVWATIVRPPLNGVSYTAANELLRRLAGEPQLAAGLQVADWSAVVAGSPGYLAGDGVHATPQGYRARAQLYADAIRACAGEG
jgi:beta-phosphoglucomutase-like phosphatase (HAD superfamily)